MVAQLELICALILAILQVKNALDSTGSLVDKPVMA
jgi:hypothetical protein